MEAQHVNAASGWLWIKQGYWLFKKSPVLWITMVSIGVVGSVATYAVPIIGDALVTLLFPALLTGYMLGCHALENDEELKLSHLFAGFHNSTTQLITLGGISLVGNMLILGVMMLAGGDTLVSILMSGKPVDNPAILMQAAENATIALLLGGALFYTLLMATQFAPMLIVFNKLSPVSAMKVSLKACLRNMLPLLLYGVMMLPFVAIASMPMMLGWLILLPIITGSMYAIYRNLCPTPEEMTTFFKNETPAHTQ